MLSQTGSIVVYGGEEDGGEEELTFTALQSNPVGQLLLRTCSLRTTAFILSACLVGELSTRNPCCQSGFLTYITESQGHRQARVSSHLKSLLKHFGVAALFLTNNTRSLSCSV